MNLLTELFLPCFYAFCACVGFCIVFNIHGKLMFYTPIGGALGWAVYLLTAGFGNDWLQFFIASVAIAIYSECMARLHKVPVTLFLLIAMLPLVPGGGIYYTMEHAINGNTTAFINTGIHTFGIAGALAVGVLLVSSLVHLFKRRTANEND